MTRARCWPPRPAPLKVTTFGNAADAPTNISVESRYCTRGSLYKGLRKLSGLNGRAQLSVLFCLRRVVLPGSGEPVQSGRPAPARARPAGSRGPAAAPREPRPDSRAAAWPCAAGFRFAAPAVFPERCPEMRADPAEVSRSQMPPRRTRRADPAQPGTALASVITARNLGSRNSPPELVRLPSRNCAHITTSRPAMDCSAIRAWLLGSSFSVLSRALRIGRARPPGPAAPAR